MGFDAALTQNVKGPLRGTRVPGAFKPYEKGRLRRALSDALKEQGRSFMTPAMWLFFVAARRMAAISLAEGRARVFRVQDLADCMARYDGRRKKRGTRTCRRWLNDLIAGGFADRVGCNQYVVFVDDETASEQRALLREGELTDATARRVLAKAERRAEKAEQLRKRRLRQEYRQVFNNALKGQPSNLRGASSLSVPRTKGGRFAKFVPGAQ